MIERLPVQITAGYDEWYYEATGQAPELVRSGDIVFAGALDYVEAIGCFCYGMYMANGNSVGYLPQSFAQSVILPEME